MRLKIETHMGVSSHVETHCHASKNGNTHGCIVHRDAYNALYKETHAMRLYHIYGNREGL